MNWATNFAVSVDPAHGKEWLELMTPRSVGLILKSIKSNFKFVRLTTAVATFSARSDCLQICAKMQVNHQANVLVNATSP